MESFQRNVELCPLVEHFPRVRVTERATQTAASGETDDVHAERFSKHTVGPRQLVQVFGGQIGRLGTQGFSRGTSGVGKCW